MGCVHMHWKIPTIEKNGNLSRLWSDMEKDGENNWKVKKDGENNWKVKKDGWM
jgi:hypothetical protein